MLSNLLRVFLPSMEHGFDWLLKAFPLQAHIIIIR